MTQRPSHVIRSSELRAKRGKTRASGRGETEDIKARLVKTETQAFRNLRGDAATLATLSEQAATILAVQTANTASFSANKGGTGQNIASAAQTKVTFGTEFFDTGGFFASSTWTPPAGTIYLKASLYFSNVAATNDLTVHIYKNGAQYKTKQVIIAGDQYVGTVDIGIIDTADGDDTYEVYAQSGDGNYTIDGDALYTWFMGSML